MELPIPWDKYPEQTISEKSIAATPKRSQKPYPQTLEGTNETHIEELVQ